MSTRGIMGLVINGERKITYVHNDAYPGGLGLDVLAQLKDQIVLHGLVVLKEKAAALEVVTDDTPITPEIEAKLAPTTDHNVGALLQDQISWYQLLRRAQGDLTKTLEIGYLEDDADFALNSLFCEWGYIIDLDREVFEVYQGFQTSGPATEGLWAGVEAEEPEHRVLPDTYWPIAPVASWALGDLPEDLSELEE